MLNRDDMSDLIERLCVAAAAIMEDCSEIALLRDTSASTDARLLAILEAGDDITTLASAAAVIMRRSQ